MISQKTQNLIRIRQLAMEREQYKDLLAEYEVRNERLLNAMEQMPQVQRAAVEDYLGLMAEMGNFLLNIACESMTFSSK